MKPTYTTTGKGPAIAGWAAVGIAAGAFVGALAGWAGAPVAVVSSLAGFVAAVLPPLLGNLLPDDAAPPPQPTATMDPPATE